MFELDELGNPIIDPLTGKPKVSMSSMQGITPGASNQSSIVDKGKSLFLGNIGEELGVESYDQQFADRLYQPSLTFSEQRTGDEVKERAEYDQKKKNDLYFDTDLNEQKAFNQTGMDQLANGLAKAFGIAGTTFAESLGGLPIGLYNVAVSGGQGSAFYDNDFTQTLDSFNEWMKEQFPNYYSSAEQKLGLGESLLTTNFWGDKFGNGLGYMAGSVLAAMATRGLSLGSNLTKSTQILRALGKDYAKIQRALQVGNLVQKEAQIVNLGNKIDKLIATGVSAIGESSVEARSTRNDIIQDLTTKRDSGDPRYSWMTDNDIIREADTAGNLSFGLNMALVGSSNFVQFGKLFSNKYDVARRLIADNVVKEGSEYLVRPSTMKNVFNIAKSPFVEAFQEGAQYWTEQTLSDYFENGTRGTDYAKQFLQSSVKGLEETLGSREGQESMLLGGILGGLFGGIGAVKENSDKKKKEFATANYLNQFGDLESIKPLVQSLANHNGYQTTLENSLLTDDQFNYENAKFGQTFNYIQSRIDAGRFDLLEDELNAYSQLPKDEFESTFSTELKAGETPANRVASIKKLAYRLDEISDMMDTRFPDVPSYLRNGMKYALATTENIDNRISDISNQIANYTGYIPSGADVALYNSIQKDVKEKISSLVRDWRDEVDFDKRIDIENQIKKLARTNVEITKKKLPQLTKGAVGTSFDDAVELGTFLNFFNRLDQFIQENPHISDDLVKKVNDITKLQQRREQFIKDYKDLVTEQGQRKMKKKIEEAIARITDPTVKPRLSNLSSEDYLDYENNRLGYIKDNRLELYKNTLNNSSKFAEDISLASTKDQKEQIGNEMMKQGVYIDPDLKKQLTDVHKSEEDRLNELGDRLQQIAQQGTPGFDEEGEETSIYTPEQELEVDSITKEMEALEAQQQRNRDFINRMESYSVAQQEVELTDGELRIKIAKEFIDKSNGILQNFELDEDYQDINSVKDQIGELKALRAIFSKRTDESLTKEEKVSVIASIDSVLEKLDNIKDEIEKRIENRERTNTELWEQTSVGTFSQLGYDLDNNMVNNEPLYNIIRTPIDAVDLGLVDNILSRSKQDKNVVLADYIKQKLSEYTKGDKKAFIAQIDSIYNEIYDDVIESKRIQSRDFSNKDKIISQYKLNPKRGFNELLKIIRDQMDLEVDSPFSVFIKDQNLPKFRRAIQKQDRTDSVVSSEEIINIIDNHQRLSDLYDLKTDINSDYSIIQEILDEQSIASKLKEGDLVPSKQQLIAIRETVKWYFTSKENEAFKNWAYLKGTAGTGKSSVISTWVKKLINLNNAEIYGVGHNDISSENINRLLGTSAKTSIADLLGKLRDNSLSDKTKLIILDEVAALSTRELIEIDNALIAHNKWRLDNKKNQVKILSLGDPNQITKYPTPPIENSSESFGEQGTLYSTEDFINITNISPLTIVYRTDVAPITEFANKFLQKKLDVRSEPVYVTSNVSNIDTAVASTGVYGAKEFKKDLLRYLNNQTLTDGKKRVVIVNPEDIDSYKNFIANAGIDLSKIEVIDPVDAQGRTIDEVFLSLESKGSVRSTVFYNPQMYVSSSRAKTFLMIGELNTINVFDADVAAKKEDRSKENTQRLNNFKEDRDKEKELLSDQIGNQTAKKTFAQKTEETNPKKDDQVKDPTEIEKEEDFEVTQEEIELAISSHETNDDIQSIEQSDVMQEPLANVKVSEGKKAHILSEPTSSSIAKENTPGVKAGDNVLFIKVRDTNIDNTKDVIKVVQKAEEEDEYRIVAVLNNNELNGPFSFLRSMLSTDSKRTIVEPIRTESGNIVIRKSNIDPVYKSKVVSARTLSYDYSSESVPLSQEEKERTIDKFMDTFFRKERRPQGLRYKVEMYTNNDIKKLRNNNKIPDEFIVDPGVPYIHITSPKAKGSKSFVTKDQFIRLSPAKYNINKHSELFTPLQDFISLASDLENITKQSIGDPLFNKAIRDVANGFYDTPEVESSNIDVNNQQVVDLCKRVFDLVYQLPPEESQVVRKGETVKVKDDSPEAPLTDKNGVTRPRKILNVETEDGQKIAVFEGGRRIPFSELEWSGKRTAGPAQHALNLLALSNLTAGDFGLARITRVKVGDKTQYIRTGKSLLGDSTVGISSFTLRPYLQRLEGRRQRLDPSYKPISSTSVNLIKSQYSEEEFQNLSTLVGSLPSLYDLKMLLDFDSQTGDSVVNQGFGLRVPIPKSKRVADQNVPLDKFDNLEDYLTTNFEGVIPTQVVIEIDNDSAVIEDSNPKTSEDEERLGGRDIEDDLFGSWGSRLLTEERAEGKDLGYELQTREVLNYIKSLLPNINESQLKFLSSTEMLKITKGIKAYGLWRDGVIYLQTNKDNKVNTRVIRHEVFHEVYNNYLTNKERSKLLKIARRDYSLNDQTDVQVEEFLADKYQEWETKKSKPTSFITSIFKKIKDLFDFIFNNNSVIDQYFDKIDSGYFNKYSLDPLRGERYSSPVVKKFDTVEGFREAKRLLLKKLDDYKNPTKQSDSHNQFPVVESKSQLLNVPMTTSEAIYYTMRDIKVGLYTLTERYKEREGPLTEKEKHRLDALTRLSDPSVFKEMLKDIYPTYQNANLSFIDRLDTHFDPNKYISQGITEGETTEDFEDEWENLDEDVANLYEQIVEGDRINWENRLTESVKHFLSSILLNGEPINSKQAYAVLGRVLTNITGNSASEKIKQIKQAFLTFKSQSKTTIAIENELVRLISFLDEEQPVPQLKKIVSNFGTFKFSAENSTNLDLFEYPTQRLVNGKLERYIVRVNKSGTDSAGNKINIGTSAFFRKIKNLVDQHNKENNLKDEFDLTDLKVLYLRAYYANTLNEMMASLNSLRTKNVWYGLKTYDYGKPKWRYSPFEKEIDKALQLSVIKDKLSQKYPVLQNYYRSYYNVKSAQDKKNHLNNLFKSLGLGKGDIAMTYSQAVTIHEDILRMVDEFENSRKEAKLNPKTIENEDGVTVEVQPIFSDILENSNTRLVNIANVLSAKNDRFENATTYIGGDGKPRWYLTASSQAIDTMVNIINQRILPPYLRKNSFYKFNPINPSSGLNINKVYSYFDHDSLKNDFSGFTQLYKREKEKGWLDRNFNFQFLAALSNISQFDDKVYAQQVFTISNKPNILGAFMKVLDDNALRKSIGIALLQESVRSEKDIKNYDKNLNKSYIIGQDNKITIEDVRKALNNNELTAEQLQQMLSTDKGFNTLWSSLKLDRRVNTVLSKLENDSVDIAKMMVEQKMIFDSRLPSVYNSLLQDRVFNFPGTFRKYKIETDTFNDRNKTEGYDIKYTEILPLVDLWVKNNYINSLFLNQLLTGDEAYFKNAVDEIKRMSGAHAIGQKGNVMGKWGMREKFNVIVGKDIKDIFKSEYKDDPRFRRLLEKSFESTDGQGFMTPERYNDIVKGFGQSFKLGKVLKPVHYEIDKDGIPRFLKYSSIVLTDELVKAFPDLRTLRDKMQTNGMHENDLRVFTEFMNRKLGQGNPLKSYELDILNRIIEDNINSGNHVDEFVFETALKVGVPNKTVPVEEERHTDFSSATKFTLSNYNYRIQLNPKHHTDSHVKTPSQIIYQLNTNTLNLDAANRVYGLLSRLTDMGLEKMSEVLGKKAGIDKNQLKKVKDTIASKVKYSSTDKRFAELINNKDISINFPYIVRKAIASLNSMVSNATVGTEFSGTKLVLESAYGTRTQDIMTKNGIRKYPELVVDPKSGEYYMECYLPDIGNLRKKLNISDEVFFESKDLSTLFGFRIPSTELHSAVPIKVIGFYPVEKGSEENIIIAPKELVLLHGSDFDVDSLFAIRKDPLTRDLNDYDGNVIYNTGDVLQGFETINKIEAMIKDYYSDLSAGDKNYNGKEKDKLTSTLKSLDKALETAIKNTVISELLDIIQSSKNLESMMAPITMDRFNGDAIAGEERVIPMIERVTGKKFTEQYDLKRLPDQLKMHQDNFLGVSLTGQFANYFKALAYIFHSVGENADVPLKDKYHITVDGFKYTSLHRTERTKDGELEVVINDRGDKQVYTIWETLDSLINAAIDNVKVQILPKINATNNTAKGLVSLIAMGVPVHTVVKILLQPSIMELSKGIQLPMLKGQIKNKLAMLKQINVEELPLEDHLNNTSITSENLERDINKKIDDMNFEELLFQYYLIDTFQTVSEMGDYISNTSGFLKILKHLPSNYADVQDVMDKIDTIYKDTEAESREFKDNYPFIGADILSIPHIQSAFKTIKKLKTRLEQIFLVNNKALIEFSKKINQIVKIGLAEQNYDTNENLARIREEFLKYILTGYKEIIDGKELSMDTTNEKPYKGFKGVDAWVQRFIDETLRPAVENNTNNLFLSNITIEKSVRKGELSKQYISFLKGSQMNNDELYEMEIYFDKLSDDGKISDLQLGLIKYAVLTQGLSFGARSYTAVIPPRYWTGINQYIDNQLLDIFADEQKGDSKFDNLLTHFAAQLLSKNTESLIDERIKKNIVKTGNTKMVRGKEAFLYRGKDSYGYFDLKVKGGGFKSFISQYGSIYYNIGEVEQAGEITTYFQKVKNEYSSGHYQFNNELFKNGYDIQKVFGKDILAVQLDEPSRTIELTRSEYTDSYSFKEGMEIYTHLASDPLRLEMKKHYISSVREVGDKYKISLTEGEQVDHSLKQKVVFDVYSELEHFYKSVSNPSLAIEEATERMRELINSGFSEKEALDTIKCNL